MPGSNSDSLLLKEMADELFQMQILSIAARSRSRRMGATDLTESEFIVLDLLLRHGISTVGDLQRHVGVLPAQMSRVIRSLEKRSEGPLIKCKINKKDKRKIDVEITKLGKQLHKNYKDIRLQGMSEFLKAMDPKDCREFMRICRIIRGQIEDSLMR